MRAAGPPPRPALARASKAKRRRRSGAYRRRDRVRTSAGSVIQVVEPQSADRRAASANSIEASRASNLLRRPARRRGWNKLAVLLDGEPVGHAGDVVAHHPGAAGLVAVLRPCRTTPSGSTSGSAMNSWNISARMRARLAARAVDPLVAVHAARAGIAAGAQRSSAMSGEKATRAWPSLRDVLGGRDARRPGARRCVSASTSSTMAPIIRRTASSRGMTARRCPDSPCRRWPGCGPISGTSIQVVQGEQPGLHPVVHVVVVVGDVVGQGRHLGLRRGAGVRGRRS